MAENEPGNTDTARAVELSRAQRWRRLRASIATGTLARGLSTVTQLVSVAVAVRQLGPEAFGSFVVISALVGWLGLTSVGVGPGLTRQIAASAAVNDRRTEARAFSSSFVIIGAIGLVGAIVVVAVFQTGEPAIGAVDQLAEDIRSATLLLALLAFGQAWLGVIEAAQLGHQEQYWANGFQATGSITALVLLLTLGSSLHTITEYVLVVIVPIAIARFVNAWLYLRRRTYLLTRHLSVREAAAVAKSSASFAVIQAGSYASQQVGLVWLATVGGVAAAAPLGVMFRLTSAAAGPVALITQPLWPAIADAAARHDPSWARSAYRRTSLALLAYAIAVAVAVVSIGPALLRGWVGTSVHVETSTLALVGAYFVAGVWAHLNAITLVGLGRMWTAAAVICLEATISIAGALLLAGQFGIDGVLAALLAAVTIVSGFLLPLAVSRSWRNFDVLANDRIAPRLDRESIL